jgi:hypothetical protein
MIKCKFLGFYVGANYPFCDFDLVDNVLLFNEAILGHGLPCIDHAH